MSYDFGAHEALDRSSIIMEMVSNHLLEHPTIEANAEWLALAQQAHDALFALYQSIGETTEPQPDNASAQAK